MTMKEVWESEKVGRGDKWYGGKKRKNRLGNAAVGIGMLGDFVCLVTFSRRTQSALGGFVCVMFLFHRARVYTPGWKKFVGDESGDCK